MSESTRTSQIQNNVFILSDKLYTFCKQHGAAEKQGMLNNIYVFMTHLTDKNDENMTEIANLIKETPIAYHAQALRVLNGKYAFGVLHVKDPKINKGVIRTKDLLMNETKNFNDVTNRIPSPFEVIYLTFNHVITEFQKSTGNKEDLTLFIAMMNDAKMQWQVLSEYLDAFDAKYREELMKGIF